VRAPFGPVATTSAQQASIVAGFASLGMTRESDRFIRPDETLTNP
jgi:hypothetical protein